jgi:hypothetical protein
MDCGANSHISKGLKDFTAKYSTASINITVAKQNITMQAIGIGDCTVSSLDNMGNPCKLVLQDVLYVPETGKNLIFAYCIGKDGYQVVLPSDNATFPLGVYCPRQALRLLKADSAQQLRYIVYTTSTGQWSQLCFQLC